MWAYLFSLLPSKQPALNVDEVAKAMQIDFELRLQGLISDTAYYHSNDIRQLISRQTDEPKS